MFKFFKDKVPGGGAQKDREEKKSPLREPTPENKQFEEEALKYLGLSSVNELHDLKKRIEEVKGHIRIIVHPFFSRGREDSPVGEGHDEAYTNAQRIIDTVLRRDKSSPVFLFENADRSKFPKLPSDAPKTSLITLPTYSDQGIPFVEGIGPDHPEWRDKFMTFLSKKDPSEAKIILDRILGRSFDYLDKIFKYLGVQSATASGMYLGIDAVEEAIFTGCLGDFVTELRKRNFKVDISPKFGAYSGNSQKMITEIKNAGLPVKQTGKDTQ